MSNDLDLITDETAGVCPHLDAPDDRETWPTSDMDPGPAKQVGDGVVGAPAGFAALSRGHDITDALRTLGRVAANTRATAVEVLTAADGAGYWSPRLWGLNPASVPEHSSGLALDFMVYGDRASGDYIADYLWHHRVRLGVRWVIWRQRIRSTTPGRSGDWTPMPDRGNSTRNHYDHVHVFLRSGTYRPRPTPAPPRPPSGRPFHIVVRGDTLSDIAARYHTTVAALWALNRRQITSPDHIEVGQRLTLPTAMTPAVHVVVRGDTLSDIAARYHTTVTAILAVNPRITDPDMIHAGDRVHIA